MEPNQNPPSERDWTIQEKADFYASQENTGSLFSGAVANNGVQFSDVRHFSIDEIESILNRGIHVTSIVPPEQGWPMAFHCPICKETTFLLSPWAVKPKDGDYFKMNDTCASDDHGHQHNMRMAMKPPPVRLLSGGYVDETGVHRGVPPTAEDCARVALMTMHRTLFADGPIRFQVHDPLPPQDVPSEVEFTQEMSIEEAKKRWPNTPIPGEEK